LRDWGKYVRDVCIGVSSVKCFVVKYGGWFLPAFHCTWTMTSPVELLWFDALILERRPHLAQPQPRVCTVTSAYPTTGRALLPPRLVVERRRTSPSTRDSTRQGQGHQAQQPMRGLAPLINAAPGTITAPSRPVVLERGAERLMTRCSTSTRPWCPGGSSGCEQIFEYSLIRVVPMLDRGDRQRRRAPLLQVRSATSMPRIEP